MDREIQRFETLWDVSVSHGDVEPVADDVSKLRYRSSAVGSDWETETDFHFVSLDDVVLREFAKPFLLRLWRYIVTFLDYCFSGTVFSIIRHSWRFSLYFFYPAVMIIVSALVSLLLAGLIARSGIALAWLAAPVIFLAAFSAFVQLVWKRKHVLHLMDLWSFSRDYLRNHHRAMDAKLDRLADLTAAAATSDTYDEIIMVGHSTGGALILGAAAKAHQRHKEFAAHSAKVTVLTVGSTALKVGLHPAAGWYRASLQSLFSETETGWAEYQCMTDIINFFRTQPARLMGFADTMKHQMNIHEVRIKRMVDKTAYKRMRRNFFRVHYQFVFGNTKKYHYDFLAICLGPASLPDRARAPKRFKQSLTADGQNADE